MAKSKKNNKESNVQNEVIDGNETFSLVNAGSDANPFPVEIRETKTDATEQPAEAAKGGKKGGKKEDTISRAECPEGGEHLVLPWKELTFDGAYQMRAELVNEDTATRYAELMTDGVVFPPLYVADTGVKKVVFSGFNRGAAYEKAKIKDVPVIVWKMTEREAKKWALRQNAAHGKTRTDRDVRKAINTLLDDADLLAEVCKVGGQRAAAAAVGASTGALWRALEERGQSLRGGKLVKVTKEAAAPVADDPSLTEGADKPTSAANADGKTPEQVEAEARAAQIAKISDTGLPKVTRGIVGNLARLVESSLTRADLAPHARASLEKFGFDIQTDEFGQHRLTVLGRLLDAFQDLEDTMKGLAAEKSFEGSKDNTKDASAE